MKKLLLAVVVSSVAAGSAQAVTVFEKDGFTYKMNGDLQIQIRQKVGDDEDLFVDYDDLEIKNYFSYDMGNDLKAFGRIDFDFKDHANKGETNKPLEEAYVGLQYRAVSGSFGKQNFASDEFGIEEAYETPLDEDRFDAIATDGDDTIRFDVELDNLYLVVTHELEAENKNGIEGEFTDVFVGTELAGLALAAAYQTHTPLLLDSIDTWGLSASYDFGFAGLAADYSVTDDDNTDLETTLLNLATTFDVTDNTGVAVGMQKQEEDNSDDVTGWYANVTYKFPAHKNVSVFGELADTDEDNADMGFLVGMQVKF